jgi:hypothetical protein
MLTTEQKGVLAEAAIVHAAARLGVSVAKPLAPERYDLVLDLGSTLFRVQCKSAVRTGDVVVIRCRSCRRGPHGMMHRPYTADEVDAIAAYCAELDRCFLVPVSEFPRRATIQLRLAPARNNQRRGVVWANDFAFEATLKRQFAGP